MRGSWAREILGPLIAMLLVAALVAATTPSFADLGNLKNLILQVSIIAIVAVGSTVVIFTGGIDLSPGSAIALMTVVFATAVKLWGVPFVRAILLTVLIGLNDRADERRPHSPSAHPLLHHDARRAFGPAGRRLHVQ